MPEGYYNRLIDAMNQYGDKSVVWDGSLDLTYSQLLSGIDAYAAKITEMGIRPGQHVGLCSFNSSRWLCAFFGIVKAGCVAVLMNYSQTEEELTTLYHQMDCVAFLYGSCSAVKKNPDFPSQLEPDKEHIFAIDNLPVTYKSSFTRIEETEEELRRPAFIIFTSGSTGVPKGAMHHQLNNLRAADGVLGIIPQMAGEAFCLGLPLFHIFGLCITLAHLITGGRVLLPAGFSNEGILAMVDSEKPEAIAAVMTILNRLIEAPAFGSTAARCVHRLYTGGAMLMPIQLLRMERAYDNVIVLNCYGQTETDGGITFTVADDSFDARSASVGRPLPDRTVKISGQNGFCGVGEIGEVLVKDEGNIMMGYYKLPQEKQPVDQNGWLHTGDLGFLDADGYLHLSGRSKDIIIKGGENLIPSEIESVINQLDSISSVKVIGAPNDLYGESVEACVILEKGAEETSDSIREKLKGRLSSFKTPAHFFFYDSFPLRSNGKLDAMMLKTLMLSDLNKAQIAEQIKGGIQILSITARSQRYIIEPICNAVEGIISYDSGFSEAKARNIRLCVEEMLLERVSGAYMEPGNLKMNFDLWPDFLRIVFSDEGSFLDFGHLSAEADASLRIIAHYTDRITCTKGEDGTNTYAFDYLYDKDYDARTYFQK